VKDEAGEKSATGFLAYHTSGSYFNPGDAYLLAITSHASEEK
jgi:hypothetical protein